MFNCIREARASMPSATAYGKQEHPCPKDDNVRVLLHAGSNEHPWPKDNSVHVRLHLSKESAFVSICSCAPDARIHWQGQCFPHTRMHWRAWTRAWGEVIRSLDLSVLLCCLVQWEYEEE